MSTETAPAPSESSPFRDASRALVRVPLVSDPPWLYGAVAATAVLCVCGSLLYFSLTRGNVAMPFALAALPGLALATFACSLVAFVARRRGGTLSLEVDHARVALRAPHDYETLLERTEPHGAALLSEPSARTRVLVLSQHGEPVLLLERGASSRAVASWAARTVESELAAVPLSAATPNAVELAKGQTLDEVLERLGVGLDDDVPLCTYPLPSGEILRISHDEVRLGSRAVSLDGARGVRGGRAVRRRAQGPQGDQGPLLELFTEKPAEAPVVEGAGVAADMVFTPIDANGLSYDSAKMCSVSAMVPPAVFALLVALTKPSVGGALQIAAAADPAPTK